MIRPDWWLACQESPAIANLLDLRFGDKERAKERLQKVDKWIETVPVPIGQSGGQVLLGESSLVGEPLLVELLDREVEALIRGENTD